MHIHITPRHLKLTAALHSFVAEKIEHLEHASDEVIGAHIVLWHDHQRSSLDKQFCVKVHLAVPGPDIHAEERAGDLYAAVDLVTLKLARQLRKKKTDRLKKARTKAQREKERKRRLGLE